MWDIINKKTNQIMSKEDVKICLLFVMCSLLSVIIILLVIPLKKEKENTVVEVFDKCFVACVSITCYFDDEIINGSGFFVSMDASSISSRYIATSSQMLYRHQKVATRIDATFIDPSTKSRSRSITRSVSIVGIDGHGDVALLYLDEGTPCNVSLRLHNVAKPGSIPTGSKVVMIGDPYGLDPLSCSVGNMRDSFWTDPLTRTLLTCIMTDISANNGNSGSPILDMNGSVLGIHIGSFATPEARDMGQTSFGGGICAWHMEKIFKIMIQNDRLQSRFDINGRIFFTKPWFKQNVTFIGNSTLNQHNLRDLYPKYVFLSDIEIDGMLVIMCKDTGSFQVCDIVTHINEVQVGCAYS